MHLQLIKLYLNIRTRKIQTIAVIISFLLLYHVHVQCTHYDWIFVVVKKLRRKCNDDSILKTKNAIHRLIRPPSIALIV